MCAGRGHLLRLLARPGCDWHAAADRPGSTRPGLTGGERGAILARKRRKVRLIGPRDERGFRLGLPRGQSNSGPGFRPQPPDRLPSGVPLRVEWVNRGKCGPALCRRLSTVLDRRTATQPGRLRGKPFPQEGWVGRFPAASVHRPAARRDRSLFELRLRSLITLPTSVAHSLDDRMQHLAHSLVDNAVGIGKSREPQRVTACCCPRRAAGRPAATQNASKEYSSEKALKMACFRP